MVFPTSVCLGSGRVSKGSHRGTLTTVEPDQRGWVPAPTPTIEVPGTSRTPVGRTSALRVGGRAGVGHGTKTTEGEHERPTLLPLSFFTVG